MLPAMEAAILERSGDQGENEGKNVKGKQKAPMYKLGKSERER